MRIREILTAGLVLLATFLVALGDQPQISEQRGGLDFRSIIKGAKDKVFPAVVFVKVLKETHGQGKKITLEVAGSGVLISPDGEILTNWHVIDKAVEIRCLLYDGRAFDAEIVGSDKEMDLALIKLQGDGTDLPRNLPHAVLGDSSLLKEGAFVMAMGAPWGLSRSVSMGIISCTRRFLPQASKYSIWLQTDAAISPGNSGGPLVNTDGEIVGINTRGVLFGGDMGFSIPSNSIKLFLPQLRKHGRIQWSYTGLQLQPLRDFNKNIYFEADKGVIVAGTDPGSPARRAGMQMRDRILNVNGTEINAVTEEDLPAIRRFLGSLPMDTPAEFVFDRKGEHTTVTITPRQKGKVEGDELDCPRWDMTVKTINQFDNPNLYFHKKKGVFVFGLKAPGNARIAGLNQHDILQKVDGEKISTLDDIKRIHKRTIDNIKQKHKIVITVLRNGLMRQVILDFSRDHEKE